MVVDRLGQGSHRFSELRRSIEGITGRMLTVTLRGLERDGLVRRTIHPVVPPRVDYELTPMGATLLHTIEQLIDWADGHVADIHAAQAAYDARHAPGAGPDDLEIAACEAADQGWQAADLGCGEAAPPPATDQRDRDVLPGRAVARETVAAGDADEEGRLMKPLPEDWDRAIAVVAHPDDLEYGVASAIARWTGQGKTVTYLLATRGEAGIAGMHPDEVGPLRVEEERRSAAVVGVSEVEFLDHRDGVLEYGLPLRRDLAAAFRRLKPEVVITMSFDLTWGEEGPVNHADHRAVGLAVLDACRDTANGWVFTGDGAPWTGIRDAYVASPGDPNYFTDVTATIDAGVASLREHRAYIEGLGQEFDPDEFLKNMAGFTGLAAGCEYAVGFRRYPMG